MKYKVHICNKLVWEFLGGFFVLLRLVIRVFVKVP